MERERTRLLQTCDYLISERSLPQSLRWSRCRHPPSIEKLADEKDDLVATCTATTWQQHCKERVSDRLSIVTYMTALTEIPSNCILSEWYCWYVEAERWCIFVFESIRKCVLIKSHTECNTHKLMCQLMCEFLIHHFQRVASPLSQLSASKRLIFPIKFVRRAAVKICKALLLRSSLSYRKLVISLLALAALFLQRLLPLPTTNWLTVHA